MLCSAHCFRASLRASSCREFSISCCSHPQAFLPPSISAPQTPRGQPSSPFSHEKHPQGAPRAQPDPPAAGNAICRSSAARTPSGKQPQGPGRGTRERDEPLRGRAAAAAVPLSPPKACSSHFYCKINGCFHSSCRGQTAQGFPAAFPKSGIAQAGPHHFGVECPDGRAGCQQLCNLPFLLLQVELSQPGLEHLSRACLGQAQG